jgi:hypothetical protein
MRIRISLKSITISVCVSKCKNQIVRISSEYDCSEAAFDHDVAAGATFCSPCQAGTYSSGAGWTPLLKRKERGRQINHCCLLVGAVRLGQDGDEESHVHNVTVRVVAIPGPEPVYTPYGGCACRWPGNESAGRCK